jgi:hypothetical protein
MKKCVTSMLGLGFRPVGAGSAEKWKGQWGAVPP